jgi:hypothetical protein
LGFTDRRIALRSLFGCAVIGRIAAVALEKVCRLVRHDGKGCRQKVEETKGAIMIFLGIGVGVVVILVVDGIVGFKVCKAIWKSTPWGS